MYYRLAKQEEKELLQYKEYTVYYENTPMFLPLRK